MLFSGCAAYRTVTLDSVLEKKADYTSVMDITADMTKDEAVKFLEEGGARVISTQTSKNNGNYEGVLLELPLVVKGLPGYSWRMDLMYQDGVYAHANIQGYRHDATADEIEKAMTVMTEFAAGFEQWDSVYAEKGTDVLPALSPGEEYMVQYFKDEPAMDMTLRFHNQDESQLQIAHDYATTFWIILNV
jgi:hypothetical protein